MPGFYVCPLLKEVQRLFQYKPELLMRPRVPIAERAARARAEVSGRPSDVRFDIEHGFSNLKRPGIDSLIKHLKPILPDAHIFIYHDYDVLDNLIVSVKILDRRSPKYLPEVTSTDYALFLELRFYKGSADRMELSYIKSKVPGLGGKGLVAAYNIALDAGIRTIDYYVNKGNPNAKRFYFHMDFGQRVNNAYRQRLGGQCEVTVE